MGSIAETQNRTHFRPQERKEVMRFETWSVVSPGRGDVLEPFDHDGLLRTVVTLKLFERFDV